MSVIVNSVIFTGLSGYLAYLVLTLVQNAGDLITGAAGGLLSLLTVIVIDTVGMMMVFRVQ